MLNELYKTPAGEEIDAALAFLAHGIGGAEAYTFLRLNREHIPAGCFWCAAQNGGVKSVVFNNGDRTIETAEGIDPYPGLRLLRFAGPPPQTDERVLPLSSADALEVYKILGGTQKLSPDDEARYVYRARAMREGLAKGYGVKENGKLISFAFIVAQNENSALIGDVFTRPEKRSRGLAAACVQACAAAAKKEAFVVCEEALVGFYEKHGFVTAI